MTPLPGLPSRLADPVPAPGASPLSDIFQS